MNATRWQGLYRLVNKNRRFPKMLAIALTGSEGGEQDMEEEAHDEDGVAGIGDRVSLMETRPLSATKRWRLVEILEQAK